METDVDFSPGKVGQFLIVAAVNAPCRQATTGTSQHILHGGYLQDDTIVIDRAI